MTGSLWKVDTLAFDLVDDRGAAADHLVIDVPNPLADGRLRHVARQGQRIECVAKTVQMPVQSQLLQEPLQVIEEPALSNLAKLAESQSSTRARKRPRGNPRKAGAGLIGRQPACPSSLFAAPFHSNSLVLQRPELVIGRPSTTRSARLTTRTGTSRALRKSHLPDQRGYLAPCCRVQSRSLALRQLVPARIFQDEADEAICAVTPELFDAVGVWCANVEPTTDDEFRALLAQARYDVPAPAAG